MARNRVKYYSPKRRAIYAQGESINALELFERDGWICYICEEKIDKHVRYPSWWCATIDHKKPISRGGTHTYDNCATAHLKCNQDKADSFLVVDCQ